ncbi:hypothetical protein ACIOC1_35125 [Streptomyces sp. NPDC088197]|uniref:hypothetical protein n=1 Tax=Streptomyces sp. NPDC088197 TaxID=3365840 RepID=UPI00380E9643
MSTCGRWPRWRPSSATTTPAWLSWRPAARGEKPLPELLAAYGKHTLERILVAAFGIISETGHGEMGPRLAELNADPQARLAFLLAEALRQQAVLAGDDLATAKHIGMSILGAVHAFTDADDSDALTLLRALRNEVLQSG